MKKMIYTLFVIALVASSTAFAAKVTTVALSYEDGQTVARIDVQGPIRFAHQTEVPKDGKGDRVILDVLSATHALSAKTFDHLPECQVTAIRTSQYSVQPEKVVRIVFDVTKAPLYRVEQKGNSIYVYFTDKGVKSFTSWSSSNVSPAPVKETTPPPATAMAPKPATTFAATTPSTPEQQRKVAESDRMASLSNAPAQTAPAKPTTPVTESKPVANVQPTTVKPITTPTTSPAATPTAKPATTPASVQAAKPATTTVPTTVQASKPVTTTAPTTVAQKPSEPVKTAPTTMIPATPKPEPKPMVPATIAATNPAKPADTKTAATPAPKPVVASAPTATPTKPIENKTAAPITTPPAQPTNVAMTPKVEAPASKPVVASAPTVSPTTPVENKPAAPVTTAPAQPTSVAKTEPIKPTMTSTTSTTPKLATTPATTPTVTAAPKPVTTPTSTPSTVKPVEKPVVASQPTTPPTTTAQPAPVVATKPAVTTTPATPTSPTVAATQPTTLKPTLPAEPVKPVTPPAAQPNANPAEPTATVAKTDNAPKASVDPKDGGKSIPSPDFSSDTIAEEDLMVAVDPNKPSSDDEDMTQDDSMTRPNDTSSTARFRRSPMSMAKVKGTMIAEFPKRLVVKYEQKGRRDPFATLIDDSRTTSGPTEKAVPNIDGLRLVGVIESNGSGGNRALFEDKDGFSYILESGDKVQKGYVLRIEDNTVYFQIFEYGWTRTVALKMEEI